MINREFWVFLFIIGTFLFNWPFLEIFRLDLPLYFLSAWILFIAVVAVVSSVAGQSSRDK